VFDAGRSELPVTSAVSEFVGEELIGSLAERSKARTCRRGKGVSFPLRDPKLRHTQSRREFVRDDLGWKAGDPHLIVAGWEPAVSAWTSDARHQRPPDLSHAQTASSVIRSCDPARSASSFPAAIARITVLGLTFANVATSSTVFTASSDVRGCKRIRPSVID